MSTSVSTAQLPIPLRLDRYAAYARRSATDDAVVARARAGVETLEAWFLRKDAELFYVAMAWRGWVAYA